MIDVKLATEKLVELRESIPSESDYYIRLVSEALDALGYVEPSKWVDGEYVLYDQQYAKKVDATFDEKGELLTLVDKDGNDWRMYALSHGVFDPERRWCYMKTVEEAKKDG